MIEAKKIEQMIMEEDVKHFFTEKQLSALNDYLVKRFVFERDFQAKIKLETDIEDTKEDDDILIFGVESFGQAFWALADYLKSYGYKIYAEDYYISIKLNESIL